MRKVIVEIRFVRDKDVSMKVAYRDDSVNDFSVSDTRRTNS